jgi:hypothetical protein
MYLNVFECIVASRVVVLVSFPAKCEENELSAVFFLDNMPNLVLQ